MKSLKVAAQIIDPGVQPISMLNLGQKLNLSCPISLKEICNGNDIDLTLVWIGDVHFEKQQDGRWRSHCLLPDEDLLLTVEAEGFLTWSHSINLAEGVTREIEAPLRKP